MLVDQHKTFIFLCILSLLTQWDPNMYSIYGLTCKEGLKMTCI